nr:proteasome subunit alpha [Phytoactinopolyspora halotolerans]
MQFGYVSPEQIMKDRADYARKGIARSRSVVVLQYEGGILFVAENPSPSLHKISEIYDRIAFAAVGKYNEFEVLRQAGVRLADLRGYSFDRVDVSGRALANVYAQTLGTIFTQDPKAYEVELVVAELGADESSDEIYRIVFDGSVFSQDGFSVMGGPSDQVSTYVRENFQRSATLEDSLRLAVDALGRENGGDVREIATSQLEVAVLDRSRPRRTFRRLRGSQLESLLHRTQPDVQGTGDEDTTDRDITDTPSEQSED